MKAYRKFVTDILLSGSVDILSNIKNFALIPILTKSLGITDYGIWVQMKIFLAFLVPLVLIGLTNAVVRFMAGDNDSARVARDFGSICVYTFFSGIFFCSMIFVFARPIALGILHDAGLSYIVRMFGVMLVFESFSVLALTYFRTFRLMKLYAFVSFFEIAVEFAGILVAINRGYGFPGAVAVMATVRCVFVLIKFFRIYARIGISTPSLDSLKRFIMFSLPLLASANMFYVIDSGDKYLANYFLGLDQAAVYSLACSLAYTVVLVTAPVIYMLHPAIAESCNNQRFEQARVYAAYSYKFFIILGVPFCFAVAFFSAPLVTMISTRDFSSASQYVPFLVFAFLVFQIGVIGEYIAIVFNRTKFVLYLHGGLAFFNILCNLIMIPRYHITGAVVVNAATYLIFFAGNIAYSRRLLRFSLEPLSAAVVFVLSLILISVVRISGVPGSFRIVLCVPAAFIYIYALRKFKIVTEKEIDFIRSLFFRKTPAL